MEKLLFYDAETIRPIDLGDGSKVLGIEYASGWKDYAGMGVACICALQAWDNRPRVFFQDNLDSFADLAKEATCCIGFNNIQFDSNLIAAHYERLGFDAFGIQGFMEDQKDILETIYSNLGYPLVLKKRPSGYKLDDLTGNTFGARKTGNGALAPVLFQQGRFASVIDYCLSDVNLTYRLYRWIKRTGWIKNREGQQIPINLEY